MTKSHRLPFLLLLVPGVMLLALPAFAQKATPVPPDLPTPTPAFPPVDEDSQPGVSVLSFVDEPLFGVPLLNVANGPDFFEHQGIGGGSTFVDPLITDCPGGYTTAIATFGMAWITDSGPTRVGFDTAPGQEVAILLWDAAPDEWWCNTSFVEDNFIEFSNIADGIYLVWVLTEQPGVVEGSVFIEGFTE